MSKDKRIGFRLFVGDTQVEWCSETERSVRKTTEKAYLRLIKSMGEQELIELVSKGIKDVDEGLYQAIRLGVTTKESGHEIVTNVYRKPAARRSLIVDAIEHGIETCCQTQESDNVQNS